MPGCPLRITCARPHEGAYTATASEAAYRPACLRGSFVCDVPGRLTGRYREQARSHGAQYISKISVSLQAVFASRLAPTVDPGMPARDWSAVRPPSRASPLPQLDWVHSKEIGRLAGRHREQARSHRRAEQKQIGVHPCFSPLIRPSVSSPAALDLDPPAPSAG